MVDPAKLEKLRSRIRQLDSIPTIPAVIQPLLQTLQQPEDNIDLKKVRELISYDKTIAAQCLRMANSPLFGRRTAESLNEALVAIGVKRIRSIALSCSLNQLVPSKQWALDPQTFWKHSFGCALVARKMAKLIGYPDPEKAYLAGLLHDLGIVVNSLVIPDDFRKCVQRAFASSIALDSAEEEDLGFTHCLTGKLLAEQWRLPPDQIEVIELHHNVAAASKSSALVSLVHLSDLLCRVRDLGYGYYEVLGIDLAGDVAWERLVEGYPELGKMDLARFTIDIEASMHEIVNVVEQVFGVTATAH